MNRLLHLATRARFMLRESCRGSAGSTARRSPQISEPSRCSSAARAASALRNLHQDVPRASGVGHVSPHGDWIKWRVDLHMAAVGYLSLADFMPNE